MLLGVSGGVVQAEKRVKTLERPLRHFAAHFLRLVQNDDRSVRRYHVDWPAGAELVAFGIDNAGRRISPASHDILVFVEGSGESLRVDDHRVDAGTLRKIVQLVQVSAVVDKKPCLFL